MQPALLEGALRIVLCSSVPSVLMIQTIATVHVLLYCHWRNKVYIVDLKKSTVKVTMVHND